MTGYEPGQPVRINPPGRRSFEATVIRYRADENAVDVVDPKNGGVRTIRVEHVRRRRPRRPAA